MVNCLRPIVATVSLLAATCTPSAKPGPESYRAMVYSQSFADRFDLSKRGIRSLDKGLQAIVFRVVERPHAYPVCLFDLYLDEGLDIDFPRGDSGTLAPDDDSDPLFFAPAHALGEVHSRWEKRRVSVQTAACKDDPERCFVVQTGMRAFSRQLIPGLSLATVDAMCSEVSLKSGSLEVVVLRSGRPSGTLSNPIADESSVYHFMIPDALVSHVAPRAAAATRVYETKQLQDARRGEFSVPDSS